MSVLMEANDFTQWQEKYIKDSNVFDREVPCMIHT